MDVDVLSKEARGKADKVENDLRELRNLDSQRWEVHDVAQRNLHTSIHKMTLDQQQFQVRCTPSLAQYQSPCESSTCWCRLQVTVLATSCLKSETIYFFAYVCPANEPVSTPPPFPFGREDFRSVCNGGCAALDLVAVKLRCT